MQKNILEHTKQIKNKEQSSNALGPWTEAIASHMRGSAACEDVGYLGGAAPEMKTDQEGRKPPRKKGKHKKTKQHIDKSLSTYL